MAIFDSWKIKVGVNQLNESLGFVRNCIVLWREVTKKMVFSVNLTMKEVSLIYFVLFVYDVEIYEIERSHAMFLVSLESFR